MNSKSGNGNRNGVEGRTSRQRQSNNHRVVRARKQPNDSINKMVTTSSDDNIIMESGKTEDGSSSSTSLQRHLNQLKKGNSITSSSIATTTTTITSSSTTNDNNILWWPSEIMYVPLCQEEAMVQIMFQRNRKKERGMLKDKPPFVVRKFKNAMKEHAPSMNFAQLLSLRRHHVKLFNSSKTMPQLGLGRVEDINESARIFEVAVENFLRKSSIHFWTEKEQAKHLKKQNQPLLATPDFLFPKPVLLRKPLKKNNGIVYED